MPAPPPKTKAFSWCPSCRAKVTKPCVACAARKCPLPMPSYPLNEEDEPWRIELEPEEARELADLGPPGDAFGWTKF